MAAAERSLSRHGADYGVWLTPAGEPVGLSRENGPLLRVIRILRRNGFDSPGEMDLS
jgi:hypothetical protein